MPGKKKPQRPTKPELLSESSLVEIIDTAWEDFEQFLVSDYLQQKASFEDPRYPVIIREFIEQHPDICKAIFGAGFMASQSFMLNVIEDGVQQFLLQKTAEQHQHNPKAPRA